MAKISILMNCFNGEPYLREAIDSVYAQDYTDWEIIFIDTYSTDNSAQIAKSYGEKVRYYQPPSSLSLYAARNFGLQFVTGDFLAFLDVDDHWEPKKLSEQIKIMQENPNIYFCCTGSFRHNVLLRKITKHCKRSSEYLSMREMLDVYPISLPTVIIRYNDLSKKIIYFEPESFLTGDYELFVKLVYEFKAYYLAKILATSRVHGKNLSKIKFNDWPSEILSTNTRLMKSIMFSSHERMLLDKRYVKTKFFVHLAKKEYKEARNVLKKYFLKDIKLFMMYCATYSTILALHMVKMRGF